MTRRMAWAFGILGFLLAVIAIITILLGLRVNDLKSQLRDRDQQDRITKVAQCVAGIRPIQVANAVIDDLRTDYTTRARQTRHLAKVDPTKKLHDAHLAIAAALDAKVAQLTNFPPITQRSCDTLARTLSVPPQRAQGSR